MRYLFPLAILAGCCTQPQVEPALRTSAELMSTFDHEQAVNRALVTASNPTPKTLEHYLEEQRKTRDAFVKVWNAHNNHLASIGTLSPEQVDAVLKTALELLKK